MAMVSLCCTGATWVRTSSRTRLVSNFTGVPSASCVHASRLFHLHPACMHQDYASWQSAEYTCPCGPQTPSEQSTFAEHARSALLKAHA
eukprot:1154890-Pelagomonas_calceolata.AAC.3